MQRTDFKKMFALICHHKEFGEQLVVLHQDGEAAAVITDREEDVDAIRHHAQRLADEMGSELSLVEFERVKTVDTFHPTPGAASGSVSSETAPLLN